MPHRAHWKKLTIIVPVIVFAVFCLVQARADRLCVPGQEAEDEVETCVLLKLDMDGVWSHNLGIKGQEIRNTMREAGVRKRSIPVADDFSVSLRISKPEKRSLAYAALRERFSAKDFELTRSEDGATFTLTMTEAYRETMTESVMQRSLSVLPHRLDRTYMFGVGVARVGKYCILAHVPGYDLSSARHHGPSSRVSVHYVEAEGALQDLQSFTKRPLMVVSDARQDGRYWTVLKQSMFDDRLGRYKIDSARHQTDFWSAEPTVTFRFQDTSRKRFGNNDWFFEGKRYAVLLNGKVIAISPLKDLPLNDREGRIRGFSTVADAKKVAALMNLDGLLAKFVKVSDENECAVT